MKCNCIAFAAVQFLACFSLSAGISLRRPLSSEGQVNKSSTGSFAHGWQPSPRIPPECKRCEKLRGEALSCEGMSAVCNCCKDIFTELTRDACRHFEKPLGKPYTDKNGTDCMDTIRAAMDQRNTTCDQSYDRSDPLHGLAPKRFSDMCNGTQPVGCGDTMCSEYGCNGELRTAEEKYRVIEQYKKTYDDHPCAYQDQQNALNRAADSKKNAHKANAAQAAAAKAAAQKAIITKSAAEAAAAEKAALANAAHDQAVTNRKEAERVEAQKIAAEQEAAKKAAAARVALEYALSEKAAAHAAVSEAKAAEQRAAERAAAAKVEHDKAVADRKAAEKHAKEKAAAHKAAAKNAPAAGAGNNAQDGGKMDESEKENIDEAMEEDAFEWGMEHRRRRSLMQLKSHDMV